MFIRQYIKKKTHLKNILQVEERISRKEIKTPYTTDL